MGAFSNDYGHGHSTTQNAALKQHTDWGSEDIYGDLSHNRLGIYQMIGIETAKTWSSPTDQGG